MILKGIRVLDFTQYLAGPTVTRLMAEMGAEIIKIERAPVGDPSRQLPAVKDGRSAYFVQQNLGKQSLCMDLAHDASDEVIKDLVAKVDVVVENFGPGVMEKRGWDYEAFKRINPKLLMASISAFGRNSPLSHKTGFDWIAQAFSGFMHMTGPADGSPHPVGVAVADVSAGVHAFSAIGYALFNRERTGEGQWMDISMIDCLFAMHEMNLQVPQVNPDFVPQRMGSHHPLICPCGVYKSPNGYISLLIVQGQWKNMCKAMGRPDLETDPRFADGLARAKHQAELIPQIEAWMATFADDATLFYTMEDAVSKRSFRLSRSTISACLAAAPTRSSSAIVSLQRVRPAKPWCWPCWSRTSAESSAPIDPRRTPTAQSSSCPNPTSSSMARASGWCAITIRCRARP